MDVNLKFKKKQTKLSIRYNVKKLEQKKKNLEFGSD